MTLSVVNNMICHVVCVQVGVLLFLCCGVLCCNVPSFACVVLDQLGAVLCASFCNVLHCAAVRSSVARSMPLMLILDADIDPEAQLHLLPPMLRRVLLSTSSSRTGHEQIGTLVGSKQPGFAPCWLCRSRFFSSMLWMH
jgi:hypothetical protein